MISRTGDLVHLNAVTFFEIFGFMQNKNGFAMAKPHQGIRLCLHGNGAKKRRSPIRREAMGKHRISNIERPTSNEWLKATIGSSMWDVECSSAMRRTGGRRSTVSQTRGQHATETGDDAETFGRHGHAV
jgi:hypothetical protein